MQRFLAKIGKGPKASKDLTWDESKQVMRLLIEGQATPAQTGAFLLAMRFKMESVAELAAFTTTVREYVPPLSLPPTLPLVDLPTYSGKRETFHASVGAGILAAAAGAAVLMHGYETHPERTGSAEVLGLLGIHPELDSHQVVDQVRTCGFGYLDLSLYHPPVARFLHLTRELGVENFFHPVATLLNPGRATSQIIGVSHPPYFERTAEALRMLGSSRAMVLRGVEGEPELSIASLTKALELRGERITPLSIQPKDVGMPSGSSQDMAAFPSSRLVEEASFLQRILRNEVRGGARDWIVLNASLLLYAAGLATSIHRALSSAIKALDSGAAARKLEQLREMSRRMDQPGPQPGNRPPSLPGLPSGPKQSLSGALAP